MSAKRTMWRWTAAMACVLAAGASALGCAGSEPEPGAGVLPPDASPEGVTLEDMAHNIALFSTAGNDMKYYPSTPVQVLFADWSTASTESVEDAAGTTSVTHVTNHFNAVRADQSLYVPAMFIDDSPPIFGTFPTDAAGAQRYMFDPQQIGGRYELEIDGKVTALGPEYAAGPVQTEPLLDGGGSHIIVEGAFVAPLAPGDHLVKLRAWATGAGWVAGTGSAVTFEAAYTVHVVAAE